MISWIQRSFQHHFRVVFAILLAVTVISFIFVIGSTPGVGRGDRTAASRLFFGYNIVSREDMQPLADAAEISLELQSDGTPPDNDQVQTYMFDRTAALHLADELHLPTPGDDALAAHIRDLPRFADKDGNFDPSLYETFRSALHSNGRITEADIVRVIKEDLRIEAVEKLLAGPGYALPSDIRARTIMGDTSWTLGVATVDFASYHPVIEPTDAELEGYFSQNSFRYEIPPEVSADAVIFRADDYASQVTVSDDDVRAMYDRNPERFPAPAAKPTVKADASGDFAAVRPQVEAALRQERARDLASKAAADFAYDLYQSKIQSGAPLADYLAAHKLSAQPLAPFTHDGGSSELGNSPDVSDAAFKLGADRFYSEAVPCPQGSVVLLWKATLPSRQPTLTEVRAKVRLDAIEAQKRERFVTFGQTIKTAILAGLKAGKSFDAAVQAAAARTGVQITTQDLAAFTLRHPPKDLSRTVLGELEHLDKGQISEMATSEKEGTFVYAVDRRLPSLDENGSAYVAAREQLARITARMSSGAAVAELVDAELRRTQPVNH